MAFIKHISVGGTTYDIASVNDLTSTEKTKLNGIEAGAQVNKIEKIKLNNVEFSISEKTATLPWEVQKKLVAGTGIKIEGDNISCTLDTSVFKVVSSLPTTPAAGDEKKIHVVANPAGTGQNIYKEYLFVKASASATGAWEELGSFKADVDLSDYAKKADLNSYVKKVDGSSLMTQGEHDKLQGIEAGAQKNPTKLPADGGNSDTVNHHQVKSDVPENAKFTDTVYDDTALKGRVTTAETKLTGISAGANKTTFEYTESSATLTITVA